MNEENDNWTAKKETLNFKDSEVFIIFSAMW